jgi:hypothetical protein
MFFWILVRMRNISDAVCREKDNTIFFNNFFSENCAVYEIMWDYLLEPTRPQMTIQYILEKMLFSCRVKKTRKKSPPRIYITHFPRQKWLHESVWMLRYKYIVFLVSSALSLAYAIISLPLDIKFMSDWLCPVLCIIGTAGSLQIVFLILFFLIPYFKIVCLDVISSCCVCWTHTRTRTRTGTRITSSVNFFCVKEQSKRRTEKDHLLQSVQLLTSPSVHEHKHGRIF